MERWVNLTTIAFTILIFTISTTQAQQFVSFNNNVQSDNDSPTRSIVNGQNDFVEIEYRFPGATFVDLTHEQLTYQRVSIEGFSHMSEPGKPGLPAHNDHIAIPTGAQVSVEIISYETMELSGYRVYPALKAARDTYGAKEPEFEIDEMTYSTDVFYPKEPIEVVDIQTYKDCPLAIVQVRPVQFNPVTGVLKIYSQLHYRVVFTGGSSFAGDMNTPAANELVKNVILNPSSIAAGTQAGNNSRSNSKDYILITHSAYQAAADSLANWKRQLGYSVEVVSQSSWTPSQVKDAIHTRYQNWTPHPQYFVILGDHTGSYAVPGEIHYDVYYNEPFATDLYYACMDGVGDHYPDMAHGRISVSSPSQAMQVVMKNINYERNPPNNSSFYNSALNCAQYQDDNNDSYADRRFTHTSEEIRDYVMSKGKSVNRVYWSNSSDPTYYNNGLYSQSNTLLPAELRDPGFNWNGGSANITSNINNGRFYVFHRDHGYVGGTGWSKPYYTTGSISGLSNGDLLPVVFSINCHTGEYQLNECFAEKFIRHSGGGAVGVVAAAYYSFSGYNDALSCGMVDAIWSDPGLVPVFGAGGISNPSLSPHSDIFSMGDVVNQGKIRMTETWSGASTTNRYQFELFLYFGDPALKIWTEDPSQLTASVPATCQENSVSISGCNVPDATATAFANGILLGKTALAGGSGTINFTPQSIGTEILITLSKHNFSPIQQITTVQSGQPTAPIADFTCDTSAIHINESVHFTDQSQNVPVSWQWTFEGGVPASSTDQDPVVSYPAAGVYDVSLVVSNSGGSDIKKVNNCILVTAYPPVADFIVDKNNLTIGETANFTDLSTNDPTSWSWSFPGGTPSVSNIQNPSVIYDVAGTYEVSLTSANSGGSSTETRTAFITVTDDAYCPSSGNASEEWIEFVEFNGMINSTGSSGVLGYQDETHITYQFDAGSIVSLILEPGFSPRSKFEYWTIRIDFNADGDFSDAGEAVFSADKKRSTVTGDFTLPAGLNVSTRMRISMRRDSVASSCEIFSFGEVEDYSVIIGDPAPQPPVADFTADATTIVAGSAVQFTDLSSNNPTGWNWSFNGGSPANSMDRNPTITYNFTGTFDVTLTAGNSQGSGTLSRTSYITVVDPPPQVSYCEPTMIDNTDDFIQWISVGSDTSVSGQDPGGYHYFLAPSFNFSPGNTYPVTLEPFNSKNREFWRIWIDFNGDGDFDDNDETLLIANNKRRRYIGEITIPGYAVGCTRMRISMENSSPPGPCDDNFPGEVEDYIVNFGGESVMANIPELPFEASIYPNPVSNNLTINVTPGEPVRIRIMNLLGQPMDEIKEVISSAVLDVSGLQPGIYIMTIGNSKHYLTRKFTKK